MTETEKTEKLTSKEAIELVEKFKVLVEKYKMKNGYLIQHIFAIPTDDYLIYETQKNYEYILEKLRFSTNSTFPDTDYEVVTLHMTTADKFYWSNDITYLEELFYQHSKLHQTDNLDYPL